MTGMMLWSFSPLSRWIPRESRCHQELPGAAPLGGIGRPLPGGAHAPGSSAPRWLRLLRILARRRRGRKRKE